MMVVQVLTVMNTYAGAISPQIGAWVAMLMGIAYTASRTIVKSLGTGDSGSTDTSSEGENGTTPPAPNLKTSASLLLVAMFIPAVLFGCAYTEQQRASQAVVAVTAHAKAALVLHDAGVTNTDQEAVIGEMLKAEKDAIHAYYDAIDVGDVNALAKAKAALAAAAAVTETELAKYHAKTQPAEKMP